MSQREELPRFEIVKIGARYCAYDYLTRQARFPRDPKSYQQAEGLVALLAGAARRKGEPLSVQRVWSTPPKRPDAKPTNPANTH